MSQLRCQDTLFALLRYYQFGNRPKYGELFSKSLEYSGFEIGNKDQKWLSFVTFNALKYVGILDASETNVTRWSYSLEKSCVVEGNPTFFMGSSKELNAELQSSGTWKPFFSDNSGTPFSLYKFVSSESKGLEQNFMLNPSYMNIFESRCPDWQSIESQCLREDQWTRYLSGVDIEVFNFDECCWDTKLDTTIGSRSLVRIPLEYSGWEYRIVFPQKNRSLRVIYPEWAVVTAARLLGKAFPAKYDSSTETLNLSWRARLPTTLARYLCSQQPEVVSQYSSLKFKNVKSRRISFLTEKLEFSIKDIL